MTEKEKQAMIRAWKKWHTGMPKEHIPGVTLVFEKGFKAALDYAKKTLKK